MIGLFRVVLAAASFATVVVAAGAPQKVTVWGRGGGGEMLECTSIVPTPAPTVASKPSPTPCEGSICFSDSDRWSIEYPPPTRVLHDCKFLNGATLDQVMQVMCETLHVC